MTILIITPISCSFVQDNEERAFFGGGSVGGTGAAYSDRDQYSPTHKEMQMLRESLDQQTLQTRQALAQLVVLRDQLITETNARVEAQVRTSNGWTIQLSFIDIRMTFRFSAIGSHPATVAAES